VRKPIHIGDTAYPTKKAAGDAVRQILYAYPIGATLSDDHAQFIADVLELHAERDQKIGVGIVSFQVEQNEGSRGFWLTRTDGTRTDFSFLSCLTPRTPEADARAAFRSEVRDQIAKFRADAFAGTILMACPITGELIRQASSAHVDHFNPTFDELLKSFIPNEALASVQVIPTSDGETETRLADRVIATRWAEFHRMHAHLRIVSRRANLSLLRRKSKE
jgi:hypothetical protein